MVVCLERGAHCLHMVQLMSRPSHHLLLQQNPEWFMLLVLAKYKLFWKKAVKRLWMSVLSAFCKNPVSGRWYSFNDDEVEELTSDSAVVTSAAYLLFYRRGVPQTDPCDTSLASFVEAILTAAYTDLAISDPPLPAVQQTASASTGNY